MVCATLLLIAILTAASGATPLYCSDVQSPASGSGHNTDLSQVTTLQYCIIDNCTIMRIDTGQQLDIVYTTESLLIVTPKGGQTSVVITKVENEFLCLAEYHDETDASQRTETGKFVGVLILGIPLVLVSGYVLLVHLLFKELRNLFGKLLIFYNLGIMIVTASAMTLMLMNYLITVNSQIICHTVMMSFMVSAAMHEVFSANILTHLAYIMYRCSELKSRMSAKKKQFLFRCYFSYGFITLVLLFFAMIVYDWWTGNGKHTLLPNGHCIFVDEYSYTTLYISEIPTVINKVIQIIMFIAYIYYYIKFKKIVHQAQTSIQYDRELFKIAIAMGAALGLSYFAFIFLIFDSKILDILAIMSGATFLTAQQLVIMTTFVCTKKMSKLWKKLCSRGQEVKPEN